MNDFTQSALYVGNVRHRRFTPTRHDFSYKLFLSWINLKDVEKLFNKAPFFSTGKWPAPIAFKRKHYLHPLNVSIEQACHQKVVNDLGFDFDGEICMLTSLQYLGFCYNPVSFYYCYGKDEYLKAIIAEINNTPWNQRHSYCIDMRIHESKNFSKDFHISPFMPMDIDYNWRFSRPTEKIDIKMKNFHQEQLMFDADLNLERREWSYKTAIKMSMMYPLIPLKIVWGIYYQALRLKLKKVPFYDHPQTRNENNKEPSHG